jgi:hypothetical protein
MPHSLISNQNHRMKHFFQNGKSIYTHHPYCLYSVLLKHSRRNVASKSGGIRILYFCSEQLYSTSLGHELIKSQLPAAEQGTSLVQMPGYCRDSPHLFALNKNMNEKPTSCCCSGHQLGPDARIVVTLHICVLYTVHFSNPFHAEKV